MCYICFKFFHLQPFCVFIFKAYLFKTANNWILFYSTAYYSFIRIFSHLLCNVNTDIFYLKSIILLFICIYSSCFVFLFYFFLAFFELKKISTFFPLLFLVAHLFTILSMNTLKYMIFIAPNCETNKSFAQLLSFSELRFVKCFEMNSSE